MRASRILWVGLALLLARQGDAGPVDPSKSTMPTAISLVGSSTSGADPAGSFSVVARDLAGNPHNSVDIEIDFSQCPDFVLCTDQLDPAMTLDCAAHAVHKSTGFTNTGSVTFSILGGSRSAALPSTEVAHARIFGDGVLLGRPVVSAFDLDGAGGVGIDDLSVWLSDFGTTREIGRSDFDHDGHVSINDLSVWISVFGAGRSADGCATACP